MAGLLRPSAQVPQCRHAPAAHHPKQGSKARMRMCVRGRVRSAEKRCQQSQPTTAAENRAGCRPRHPTHHLDQVALAHALAARVLAAAEHADLQRTGVNAGE